MGKRVLSMLLAAVMMISTMPIEALAVQSAGIVLKPAVQTEPEQNPLTVTYEEPAGPEQYRSAPQVKPAGNLEFKPDPSVNYSLHYAVKADGTVEITGCTSEARGELILPNEIEGKPVTSIGDRAFSGCRDFTGSLTIPDGVTRIENSAFYDCGGFTGSLTIPDSVTSIGDRAFSGCSGFTGSLIIPKSVTNIGDRAFLTCGGTGFIVSKDNPYFSDHNGILCSKDQRTIVSCPTGKTGTLKIPNTVTSIGDFAFYGCRNFTGSLTIPDSVTSIGNSAFCGCSGFTGSLIIPNSVTSIDIWAFFACEGFTDRLTISNSMTSISNSCFAGCIGFTQVYLPSNVERIDYMAFGICTGLQIVHYDGTEQDRQYIQIDEENECLKNAKWIYKGQPSPPLRFEFSCSTDRKYPCYYTDEYFKETAYRYNPSLATMSLSLAMSAFASETETSYADKSRNIKSLLKKIGADGIQTNDWFTVKPVNDSIGVAAGKKKLHVNGEDYTLIAVAVRGGGYEREWASNLTIGMEQEHQGFRQAKEQVLSFLDSYIKEQHITGKVKFWVTGFSRAAATANLVAEALDRKAIPNSSISYTPGDIYAYCFETPAGTLKGLVRHENVVVDGKRYPCDAHIFNIVNPSDPVPYVAPAAMGFRRYGMDMYIPTAATNANYDAAQGPKAAMLERYREFCDPDISKYVVDNFQMKKIKINSLNPLKPVIRIVDDNESKAARGQCVYLSNYVTALSKEVIQTRQKYVERYQNDIRAVCSAVFGYSEEKTDIILASVAKQMQEEWGKLLWIVLFNGLDDIQRLSDLFFQWLCRALKDAGITDYNEEEIKKAAGSLALLIAEVGIRHPNYLTTMIMNREGVLAAHFPELCFAWLTSMDPNYTENAVVSLDRGRYRIIKANCAVDVQVQNEQGETVASIVDECAEKLDSGLICGINEDGEKYVVLPANAGYQINVTAREDTTVNYSIDEYTPEAGEFTRSVDYFDIALEQGKTMVAEAPAYPGQSDDMSQGSNTIYTVTDPAGAPIESNSDLTGEEAAAAYYNVELLISDEEGGAVLGGGVRQFGSFAQIEATPAEGYAFTGWYSGDQLVSAETSHRFRVERDVTLAAVFEKLSPAAGYTVMVDGVEHQNVETGTPLTELLPDYPAKAGHTLFWCENGNKVDPNMTVERDMILESQWEFTGFTDVKPSDWFYEGVRYTTFRSILSGVSATEFAPRIPMTRSMLVQTLYALAGKPEVEKPHQFVDVKDSDWFSDAVAWAVKNGVSSGYPGGRFAPNDEVNREQLAVMLHGYMRKPAANEPLTFADTGDISGWAKPAVQWAVENHMMGGVPGNKILPQGLAERGQGAVIMMNFDKLPK